MSKLTSKKGFTLIEVLCSLGVFSIIFTCMMSYELASINMKKDVKILNNNVLIMETLKNNIIYSMTYEELSKLQNDNKLFINSENITFDRIRTPVVDLFSNTMTINKSYIKLSFIKSELKVYSLNLSLYTGIPNSALVLQCNFYKGCHE
ncbi:type IV pilus modification PilV family protein [Clostridium psychrophilum]|uniref:type IV pilus modification PilV family protein n=1 Tax=Clostridium psychrophilum TaxID=132926 RepID=UPI001C0DBAEC|nr:type II secretion system protein [Clostridium psychrophilum]MBU3180138.1 type II secretion system GspH family protein [Clostridium psychrophilum]